MILATHMIFVGYRVYNRLPFTTFYSAKREQSPGTRLSVFITKLFADFFEPFNRLLDIILRFEFRQAEV